MPNDPPQDKVASARSNSFSQHSQASNDSQTAADFLRDQELLEADAREALPYSIESCTKILGPLRQNVFACLTCNPAPAPPSDSSWKPAGVCYACSVQCHGEHDLVEIFQKRNFTCDCGTTRIPKESPCTLRTNERTNTKGDVHSEQPDVNNKYNQNFRNVFCGCECDYDPFQQKGTMYQCLGLGTPETGGCGEDWYHPGCLVGMGPKWFDKMEGAKRNCSASVAGGNGLATISEANEDQPDASANIADVAVLDDEDEDEDEPPMPPGFPDEDDFEGFLCYKCVDANPWIKRYAGTSGFLPAVLLLQQSERAEATKAEEGHAASKKRKAEDDLEEEEESGEAKRVKNEPEEPKASEPEATSEKAPAAAEQTAAKTKTDGDNNSLPCKLANLPAAPTERFSLFFKDGFRDQLCHCSDCYRLLHKQHPQLLEEEEVYEPPISEDGASRHGGSTHGSGSLLERGESALRNVDRVRAIEGVMAYNHLKEQLKPFFQQFAESGQAVGAEDIKAYFAKLRGDEQGIKQAGQAAADSKDGGEDGHQRHEQSGY
ncbi:hypothetical protein C2857_007442 [Epichloe festucae Fl1]|uniref:UBR-type domain-containing protein n=1 Tax=Epichloe festucae (strain Fl1) TaxID=877507 RepID=A0A7S9KQU1_EPIFF|nr:hypothetical protein C2857_007442 [Epichloe festucae Fl1]